MSSERRLLRIFQLLITGFLLVGIFTLGIFFTAVAASGKGVIMLLSTDSTGQQVQNGDGNMCNGIKNGSVTGNGRYVAFATTADLTPGATSQHMFKVYVKDTWSGTTVDAATDMYGNKANGDSSNPSISADGHYVAFSSSASNLVSNDTNSSSDIFKKDLQTGEITRVSTDSSGNQAGSSFSPSISADGHYVAFTTISVLVPGDSNGKDDVYVKDTQTGSVTEASTDSSSNQSIGGNMTGFPSISADGRYVAFHSDATNLVPGDTNGSWDIFIKDTQAGTTVRASTDSSGNQQTGNSSGFLFPPSISADGRYVVFNSDANNLVPGDTIWYDVFVKDLQTGVTSRVSTDSSGNQANAGSLWGVDISSDGTYVAFESNANNLVPGDTNDSGDVFVKNTQTGVITRVSTSATGDQSNGCFGLPSISKDGHYVSFYSTSDDLIPQDSNGKNVDFFLAVNDQWTNSQNDTTPPVTNPNVSRTDSMHATLSLDCTDGESGCQSTYYELDGGGFQAGNSFDINTSGDHTVTFHSIDNAGNIEMYNTISVSNTANYYFPWYDSQWGRTWILGANTLGSPSSLLDTYLSSQLISYELSIPGGKTVPQFFGGKMGGPIRVVSRNGKALVSERSLFGNSFEEIWAQSDNDLDSHYWWPIYDGQSMRDWVLVSNPPDSGISITATVTMHDVKANPGGLPTVVSNTIAPGQSWQPIFPGMVAGPVEVNAVQAGTSTPAKVIASQRVLYGSAFNEMPGIGASHLSPFNLWTWYDNNSPGASNWITIGNPNQQEVFIKVVVGNNLIYDSYNSSCCSPIEPNQTKVLRANPGAASGMGGPVIVVSCGSQSCDSTGPSIFASQRVIWGPSFSEIAGTSDLGTKSHWTWYDQQSAGARNWVLIANPSVPEGIYVVIKVAGTVRWAGNITQGSNVTPTFPGVMGGPVDVEAWDVATHTVPEPVFASQRVLWNGYFNELVGKDM